MDQKELEANVARGAKLLSQRMPDWKKRISLRRLRMHDRDSCILGQLKGDFANGLGWLWPAETSGNARFQSAVSHGFDSTIPYNLALCASLREAWIREIEGPVGQVSQTGSKKVSPRKRRGRAMQMAASV
ncbi:MAG: hypothetical protein HY093_04845 [Candidatus Liptonbacteria bacterium]|nr:hypothetical protein [Candidatus Liptonbacteria bacterium]